MKKLFVSLIFISAYLFSFGQDTAVIYSEVIIVDPALMKNDLFNSARAWFNTAFENSKEVLQIQDKETGELSGKGIIVYSSKVTALSGCTSGTIRFSINIFVKEGRYKYELKNFIHEGTTAVEHDAVSFGLITTAAEKDIKCFDCWGKAWKIKVWNDIKDEVNIQVISLISGLKESMNKKANTDW